MRRIERLMIHTIYMKMLYDTQTLDNNDQYQDETQANRSA